MIKQNCGVILGCDADAPNMPAASLHPVQLAGKFHNFALSLYGDVADWYFQFLGNCCLHACHKFAFLLPLQMKLQMTLLFVSYGVGRSRAGLSRPACRFLSATYITTQHAFQVNI